MKLSDILKVVKRKNGGYEAALLGVYSHVESTRDAAMQGAINRVVLQCTHAHDLTAVSSPDGTIWVLRYAFGWEYTMHGAGRAHASACLMACKTREEAYAVMMQHKTQYDEGLNVTECYGTHYKVTE